jgi:hypothetical protein
MLMASTPTSKESIGKLDLKGGLGNLFFTKIPPYRQK